MEGQRETTTRSSLTALYCFDLDGTLCDSKQIVPSVIKKELSKLLRKNVVVVMSGAPVKQFQTQLLRDFQTPIKGELYIVPTSGASCYKVSKFGNLESLWDIRFNFLDKVHVGGNLVQAIKECLGEFPPAFDDPFEDRDGQITWSALGQTAPLEEKKKWDADKSKRTRIVMRLRELLQDKYQVALGGSTSIDITPKGVNKAFALLQLMRYLKPDKTVYVGDDLGTGGNDECVKSVPLVECVSVTGPSETLAKLIRWNE